jgi:endonuclease/exonuclease/phosphatase family metal-dependent hydrolase
MKTILLTPILFLAILLNLNAQTLKVMTYNIRLDVASDSLDAWTNRKESVCDLIRFYEPDVFGIQEAMPHQMHFIDSALSSYKFLGEGRDGGNHGEYSAIFYKSNHLKVLESSTFWLSETPEKYSMGWDAACPRICTYALFEDTQSGKLFWVFNTHLDHKGDTARVEGVKLLSKEIALLNTQNYPVLIMGDFNATPQSKPIQYMTTLYTNTKAASHFIYGSKGTFNGFKFNPENSNCIDYIFISPNHFSVLKHAVINDSKNRHYPSDHFPVFTKLRFN